MQTSWKRVGFLSHSTQLLIAGITGAILGLLFYLMPPQYVALTVGVFALAVMAIRRPEYALMAILIMTSTVFPDTVFPLVNIGVGNLYITDLIIVALLVLIFMRWLVDRDFDLRSSPMNFSLIVFIGWSLFTAIRGYMMGQSELGRMIPELRIAIYYGIFFLMINLLREKKSIDFMLNWFFSLATIVAAVMIVQYVFGTDLPFLAGRVEVLATDQQGVTRITDTVGEGLITAAFMLKTVMLFIDKIRFRKWLDLLQWAVIGVGLIMTFNRTHWLMAVFVFGFSFLLSERQDRKKIIYWTLILIYLIPLLVGFVLAFAPNSGATEFVQATLGRFFSVVSPDSYRSESTSTLLWRNFEYEYGIPQMMSNPVFGIGMGALYRPYVAEIDHVNFDGRHYSHNGHLWIAMKTGLVGFFFWVWFGIAFVARGLKKWRLIKDLRYRGFVLGSTLVFLSIMFGTIAHPITMTLFWLPIITLMMGISEVLIQQSANSHQGV